MNLLRALSVIGCAILFTDGAANAQVRGRSPDTSGAAANTGAQDGLGREELQGSAPCPRWKIDDNQPLKWWNSAWTTICIEKVRSDAVAMAWSKGKSEHGATLDENARARKLAELESWLRRLTGKFHIEGKRWNSTGGSDVRGTAECFAVGDGPGASCVISAGWKPRKEPAKRDQRGEELQHAVRPQSLVFGLAPDKMEIRVTHVDTFAVRMRGFLLDDAVILNGHSSPEILAPPSSPSGRGTPGIPPDRVSPDFLHRSIPEPLSRIAINSAGDIDMAFYVYPPDMVTFHNQPIDFRLRLHRDPQIEAVASKDVP